MFQQLEGNCCKNVNFKIIQMSDVCTLLFLFCLHSVKSPTIENRDILVYFIDYQHTLYNFKQDNNPDKDTWV